MSAELYLIRHAPIAQTGCYTGQRDVPAIIPERFAEAITPLLPKDALWFSSPLLRAVQTAQALGAENIQLISALKEQHFGAWEGKSYAEIECDWSAPETILPEGGERFTDVCARVDAWLKALLAQRPALPVIIVAHAGSIRAVLRYARNITPAEALSITLDYSSVTKAVL